MKFTGRRDFLKLSGLAASGLMLPFNADAHLLNLSENVVFDGADTDVPPYDPENLHSLAYDLLKRWGDGLLALQVTDPKLKGIYGGILCPACSTVHGRNADAIFPMMYLASRTKEKKYQDAAIRLYDWMESKVSMPDGSWVSEIVVSDWNGISVFTAIMLAETLTHFGHMLDATTKQRWDVRLNRAAEFLYKDFTIHTGNINYPIACTYALALIGTYFDEPKFLTKAKQLTDEVMNYFTPNDHLIYGEGHPDKEPTNKGCYSVDLGYNVEESLQALVLYARLTKDTRVFNAVLESMKAHMEFMLPDGGWDNSWGTRNFKWTYWGSRTSDGCQPGFAVMAAHDPRFYQVALRNTQLLNRCTHNNLLHGGPHYVKAGVPPCVHHTFCHCKALTTLLLKTGQPSHIETSAQLPRLQEYGVKTFKDIQTWLIAKGKWRGTVTGYDEEYLMKSGHASGGALSMLWHKQVGPVIAASMTTYQLVENFNMQRDRDPNSMSLTPRFQLMDDIHLYTNIHDLKAEIQHKETADGILFETRSALVDDSQVACKQPIACAINYNFGNNTFVINAQCNAGNGTNVKYILPIIAAWDEKMIRVSDKELKIEKPGGTLHLTANAPFSIEPTTNGRIFNYVPGLQAIPISFTSKKVEVTISIA